MVVLVVMYAVAYIRYHISIICTYYNCTVLYLTDFLSNRLFGLYLDQHHSMGLITGTLYSVWKTPE